MAKLNETPGGDRLHIGIFGKTNSGKSTLLNVFTGQAVSIVSEQAGTTTDPVYKSMEIAPLGPCVWMDTAGFGDATALGAKRMEKTRQAAEKADIALIMLPSESICGGDLKGCFPEELEWAAFFQKRNTPVLLILGKADLIPDAERIADRIGSETGCPCLPFSACAAATGVSCMKEMLLRLMPEGFGERTILADHAQKGDLVLLVMPQDIQAPKGRLILPQVQTLRELLDRKCMVVSCTTDKLEETLGTLKKAPDLIITDSQAFGEVYALKPKESRLTSFSVLFAAYKGDIDYYVKGAETIAELTEHSKVLIAECCTHAPLTEDIGRVKIPRMLRQRYGAGMQIDLVSGTDFPEKAEELSQYDLIIQCGACMFHRKYVMARIQKAKDAGVPMCNYGVTIAYLKGILDKVEL